MKLPDFLIIPSILIQDKNLQPLDREVYGIIYWISKLKNEPCDITNAVFAGLLDVNVSSISHSLKRLYEGRYVYIEKNVITNQRSDIIPLVVFKGHVLNEQPPVPNAQGHAQMSNPIIYNNNIDTNRKNINIINNKKELLEKKSETVSLEALTPPPSSENPPSSKTSIVPLTDLERWEMATTLDVPLWIIKQTDKNFWNYIEDPKNLKKYKTSYKTIKRWVEMGLQKGNFQNCNEVEKLELQSQHPDKLREVQEVFEWARQEELKKEEEKRRNG